LTGLETGKDEPATTKAYVYDAWSGFCRSFEMAFGFAWVVLKSLWLLITFQIPITEMGGTITTISTIATYASESLSYLLIFIPLIAANLAVFNLLPIPALDGSHVLFTLIEWIRGKPINRKVESMIHFVGLCILFGFVVIVDILHFVL
ncbi:MAG: site-2 protease family protein, partial [Candidatus Caccovivens sp.]